MPPKFDKPSSLTVPLLRAELANRGLATTGLKVELVSRLTEALEGEEGAATTAAAPKAGGGGDGDDVDGDAELVREPPRLCLWSDPYRLPSTRSD